MYNELAQLKFSKIVAAKKAQAASHLMLTHHRPLVNLFAKILHVAAMILGWHDQRATTGKVIMKTEMSLYSWLRRFGWMHIYDVTKNHTISHNGMKVNLLSFHD